MSETLTRRLTSDPNKANFIRRSTIDCQTAPSPSFLVTAQGNPFTGFANWFRAMVAEVKIEDNGVKKRVLPKGLSPHGLRKATCRRLAEAGCTAHEIVAISDHRSLSEVTRYTTAASRSQRAQYLRSDDRTKKVQRSNPSNRFDKLPCKRL